ncbi:hypothetical protein GSI_03168 [Ganoderma sinense ZZ0214-1]|uniref:AB hydrolase-1 domain-containing protein n=1 Tax=Ganoderma sinense ZZ0214-1 TaxID=1077348 RepID=A0A2G8SKX7_9APHY|nr:hypothetical protein GSI_03168 [Ganoderma sinense ZZ0214-1]
MASNESTGQRLGVFHDTGAPEGSADYTTLVIVHGYVWHGGVFTRLLPLAKEYNTRVILLNRRGYPGSAPYTDEELASFPELPPGDVIQEKVDEAGKKLDVWMRERTYEILHFLEDLVKADSIPQTQPGKNVGGIVVVGWSFAALMALSIVSYGPTFPANNDVDLGKYLRRVVMHDPGLGVLGYIAKEGTYQPALDVSLSEEQRAAAFDAWIGGYYAHGSTLDSLASMPLAEPPSTISTLSPEEKVAMTHPFPDVTVLDLKVTELGVRTGLTATLRERALYDKNKLPGRQDGGSANKLEEAGDGPDTWREVELRLVWCEKSVMQVPYGMMLLGLELEEARKTGAWIRDVRIVRVKEGNHFVHWDHPALAMRAFLRDELEF